MDRVGRGILEGRRLQMSASSAARCCAPPDLLIGSWYPMAIIFWKDDSWALTSNILTNKDRAHAYLQDFQGNFQVFPSGWNYYKTQMCIPRPIPSRIWIGKKRVPAPYHFKTLKLWSWQCLLYSDALMVWCRIKYKSAGARVEARFDRGYSRDFLTANVFRANSGPIMYRGLKLTGVLRGHGWNFESRDLKKGKDMHVWCVRTARLIVDPF